MRIQNCIGQSNSLNNNIIVLQQLLKKLFEMFFSKKKVSKKFSSFIFVSLSFEDFFLSKEESILSPF